MDNTFVRDDFDCAAPATGPSAEQLLAWAGEIADDAVAADIYRHKEGRKTVRFQLGERVFFLKLHTGIGWREILKNLIQGRLPVLGAGNEYRAVAALAHLGIDTLSVAAYATAKRNPAAQKSMLVTDELSDTVSLEDYCANWSREPPPPGVRMRLIRHLAQSARAMHAAGINHRDFYLCHFHLDESSLGGESLRCYLIDLHRAQMRRSTPLRWRAKDLAALYFSAMDCGLTRRDTLRFMHHYSAGGLRQALEHDARLWRRVVVRALRLRRKEGSDVASPLAATAGQ